MFTGVLRKKIWSDLFDNVSRTIQVVLIIAIGAFAVGTIVGATQLIQKDIVANWLLNNPGSILMTLGGDGIDKNLVDTIEKYEEVDHAEGQYQKSIKWRPSPADPWQPATLIAREDYNDMELYTPLLLEGDWPTSNFMTINRGFDLGAGDQVYLEINDKERVVELSGITWYMYTQPPNFGGSPEFFTTKERFTELTGIDKYKYLTASVPGQYTEAKARAAARRIQDTIEKEEIGVYPGSAENTKYADRNKHPAQDPINGIFFILQVMAFAALILGLFLVFNTITAIISQQVPQIGVLKAIGATRGQVLLLYYTTVLLYGLMALLLSIPMAAVAGHGLRAWMVSFISMDPGPFALSGQAIITQVAICILSPVIISTIPILRGSGITVREAISSYGLTGGGGLIDRLMARLAFLPRMTSMAVSNTFRNKTRMLMTQFTLVGAGVLFIAVMSAQSSVRYTFGPVLFDTLRTNLMFNFEEEERFHTIDNIVYRRAPGHIQDVEMWAATSGEMRLAGQAETFEDRNVTVTGLPIPSTIYAPRLRAGRLLLPEDTYALVIHQNEADKLGVGVGDWVTLDIPAKRESQWQIVGVINDPIENQRIVSPRHTLLIEDRQVGQGNNLFVTTKNSTPELDKEIAIDLRQQFNWRGYDLIASRSDTLAELSEEAISQFMIIIYMLLMMAIIIAIVGAIALSGVLSINVLERRVEIGILRAIGASNAAVGSLFITEGLLLGWLSWLIAVPISLPFSQALNSAIGLAVSFELSFDYALISIWIWLAIITILGILASWFPARGAIKVSVRESLSYE